MEEVVSVVAPPFVVLEVDTLETESVVVAETDMRTHLVTDTVAVEVVVETGMEEVVAGIGLVVPHPVADPVLTVLTTDLPDSVVVVEGILMVALLVAPHHATNIEIAKASIAVTQVLVDEVLLEAVMGVTLVVGIGTTLVMEGIHIKAATAVETLLAVVVVVAAAVLHRVEEAVMAVLHHVEEVVMAVPHHVEVVTVAGTVDLPPSPIDLTATDPGEVVRHATKFGNCKTMYRKYNKIQNKIMDKDQIVEGYVHL